MFIHKLYEHQKIYIFFRYATFFYPNQAYFLHSYIYKRFYCWICMMHSMFLYIFNIFSLQTHKREMSCEFYMHCVLIYMNFWLQMHFIHHIVWCCWKMQKEARFSALFLDTYFIFIFPDFRDFQIEFNSLFNWLTPSTEKQNSIIRTEFNICEIFWLHSSILLSK